MTLIFKTSVETEDHIRLVAPVLNELFVDHPWNFDLEDCDRILRIEDAETHTANTCIAAMNRYGFFCEELRD